MAGELENIFLKIGRGDSVLVEGGADSGKEFFCRLLLRAALEADFPVAVLSFHPEAHVAWFRQYAEKGLGLVRHAEAPDNLTEIGIALNEQAKGCRFVYIDFFEVLSSKLDANDILDAIGFNARKLKAGKSSLVQAVSPESVEPKQMSRLRELYDVVVEVKRKGERMEYRFAKHPTEFDSDWHGFSLSEVVVPHRTLAEFCQVAMEYELKIGGYYARNLFKFDKECRKSIFKLSQDSTRHFLELTQLLEKEMGAAEPKPATQEELQSLLDFGILEERLMEERYREYAAESSDENAKKTFARISLEENGHAKIVSKMIEKVSGGK